MKMLKGFLLVVIVLSSILYITKAAKTTTTTTTIIQPEYVNLISNPSVEISNATNKSEPLGWSGQTWGNNNAAFRYLKNHGQSGNDSVEVQITANSELYNYSDFGDSKWVFSSVPVIPGASYNFSDWYQSNTVSEIIIYFNTANGSADDSYIGLRTADATLPHNSNVGASSNWSEYHETFVAPYNARSISVYHLINDTGALITDNYSLVRFTPQQFNRPIVSLTFDNCWENDTYTVLPVLKNYSYHGTFYISTVFINNTVVNNKELTGIQAVKDIAAYGDEVASHSVDHSVALTTANTAELNYQLNASKVFLGSLVGINNVTDYATPFGSYNDTVVNAVKLYYNSHRTTDEGYNTKENWDPYRLIVQNMLNDTNLTEFQSWINYTVADKSWLILVYHCVKPTKAGLTDYDTPQPNFLPEMNVIKKSGITVEPINQALTELAPQIGISSTTTSTSTTVSTTTVPTTTVPTTTIPSTSTTSTTTASTTTLATVTSSTSTTSQTTSATTTVSTTIPSTTVLTTIPTTTIPTTTVPSTTISTTIASTLTTIPTTTTVSATTSTTSKTTTSTTTKATTTIAGAVNTGLGTPIVSPSSPTAKKTFVISCPAKNQSFNCINAYASGTSDQCTWKNWTGNNAMFKCTGLAAGSYIAECQAVTGTSSKCAAATTNTPYKIN